MKELIILFEFKTGNLHKQEDFKRYVIAKYERFAFITNNSCIIWTDDTAVTVRDILKQSIGAGDKLFVGGTSAPAAWLSLSQPVSDYLKNNLK
jgi:hypothetical protein